MQTHRYNVAAKRTEVGVAMVIGGQLIRVVVPLYLQSPHVTLVLPGVKGGVLNIVLKQSVCMARWVLQVCVAFFDGRRKAAGQLHGT